MKHNGKIKFYIGSRSSILLKTKEAISRPKRKGLLGALKNAFVEIFYATGLAVLAIFRGIGKAIFGVCFHTGDTCINGFLRTIAAIKKDVYRTKDTVKMRWRKLIEPNFAKTLGLCLLILGIGSAAFASLRLTAKGLEIKNRILSVANIGSRNLENAKEALTAQDWANAESRFLLAYRSFNDGRQQMRSAGLMLNQLLGVLPQKQSADNLLESATLLSKSGTELIELYKYFQQTSVTAEGLNTELPFPELISEMDRRFNSVSANLDRANDLLASVDAKHFPKEYREKVLTVKNEVSALNGSFASLKDVYEILSGLLLGQKNVLVLFENNNELRPSGGFVGVVGNFKIDNGKISKFHIGSVYDLDGQLTEKIVPPVPVMNVNDRWFLRDSNWFASFPASAKKAANFYEKEGGETPDAVLALTPSVISDILKITGPISLPKYGATVDAENFVEMMQAISTVSRPNDSPKQALADFFPVLMQKIGELQAKDWAVLTEILQQNLNAKHLIVFSRDSELQSRLSDMRWTGEIAETEKDYLHIVSANLGGTKTDLYMEQEVYLKSAIDSQGTITNELTITRKNGLPKMDNTENLSFIRVLVPKGSVLLSGTGFDYKNLDTHVLQDYKTDQQVLDLEKGSLKDLASGTIIGQEEGKTYFGNWQKVEGGETKTVKLTYRLPFKLKNIDGYSLLIQKQAGTRPQKFGYEMDFDGRRLVWKNFEASDLQVSHFKAGLTLDKDQFLGAVFDKK